MSSTEHSATTAITCCTGTTGQPKGIFLALTGQPFGASIPGLADLETDATEVGDLEG